MSSIASQLVFHPVINRSLKLGSSNLVRDKLYRAIQYFARFYAWWLISKKNDKDQAARWAALKSHLGIARKLMRLGKPVEMLQAAMKAIASNGSPAEQVTMIARSLSYFGFLSLDSVVWAQTIKFINLPKDTAQLVAKRSNQFWFAGIAFSLLNSAFKGQRLLRERRRVAEKGEKDLAEMAEREEKLKALDTASKALRSQITMDALDIWIPATGAGITHVNEGTLGAFGFITSMMALSKQWHAAK